MSSTSSDSGSKRSADHLVPSNTPNKCFKPSAAHRFTPCIRPASAPVPTEPPAKRRKTMHDPSTSSRFKFIFASSAAAVEEEPVVEYFDPSKLSAPVSTAPPAKRRKTMHDPSTSSRFKFIFASSAAALEEEPVVEYFNPPMQDDDSTDQRDFWNAALLPPLNQENQNPVENEANALVGQNPVEDEANDLVGQNPVEDESSSDASESVLDIEDGSTTESKLSVPAEISVPADAMAALHENSMDGNSAWSARRWFRFLRVPLLATMVVGAPYYSSGSVVCNQQSGMCMLLKPKV
ncbi:expressed unknown protein [Seminavis robusta]|uniref:Uncharacterized protein n=1 Tax=Seminavis robusta TaxID=568900 RepID=A0A9N8F562_9STRA|nr:expressed unknown protein [Seminavis robusta]|eukprot:Sro3153_g344530.1 n/a (293) ;mRNA; r:5583-6461